MTALLEVKDVSIRFGGVVAADGISLAVQQSEQLAIIGPNGAGKTTFLNICTGYLSPNGGMVYFQGRDITRMAPRKITKLGIARAFQIPQLFLEQTVIENLLLAVTARRNGWSSLRALGDSAGRDEAGNILTQLGVADHARRRVDELPEGTRKLVDIALALALNPRLLLMDEPTSGVASAEKFAVMDVLVSNSRSPPYRIGVCRARHGCGDQIREPGRGVEWWANSKGWIATGSSVRSRS